MAGLGKEETMNQQEDKEDGGLGSNAQGFEPKSIKRCIPKSKRIKIDDPNIQPIKSNQVDDEVALSDSSAHERPFEGKSEEPFVPFLEDVDEPKMSTCDYMMSQLRPKWQQELAKRVKFLFYGIDIKTLEQANWEGTCGSCGDVDKHPTLDCPYAEFIDT